MANSNTVDRVSTDVSSKCPAADEEDGPSTIEIILYDGSDKDSNGDDDEDDYMVVLEEIEEDDLQVPYHSVSRPSKAALRGDLAGRTLHTPSTASSRSNSSVFVSSTPSTGHSNLTSMSNTSRKGQWSHHWKICEENVPTRAHVTKFQPAQPLAPRPAKVLRVSIGEEPRTYPKQSVPAAPQDKTKLPKVKQFSCVECGSSFSNKNYFREHLKKHGDVSLWCDICSKEMCSKETLESHMRLHRNERPYPCTECTAAFPGEKNLREHVKRLHSGETFKCGTCGKELATADSLKAHESLHRAEKPFHCRTCGAAYPNNKRLLEHTKRQHGDVHKCSICEKVLATRVTLEAHERLHRNEKEFGCDQCSKTFADRNYLREHQKRHRGRTFPCGQCEKQLATKSSLRAHEKLHDNIRPFGCDVCWATFAEKGQLKVHMRKHTGEKPYKCHLCSYAASQKHSVARHMFVKHNEGDGKPDTIEGVNGIPEGAVSCESAAVVGDDHLVNNVIS